MMVLYFTLLVVLSTISGTGAIKKVAFHAYATNSRGHYQEGRVLVFPTVALNDGLGYNRYTGIFHAPVPGVYHFTAHICHAPTKHMVAAIFKGGHQIAITTGFEDRYSSCSSISVISRLNKKESVYVKARWGDSHLQSDIYRWPSFSGYLIY